MAYTKEDYEEDLDTYVKEKAIKGKPISEQAEHARYRVNQHPGGASELKSRGYKEHR